MIDQESTNNLDRLKPGVIIAEKYRIEGLLGRGGMGVVMAAEHLQLRERVALKFLRVDSERAEEFRSRFLREAQVTAKLRSEHVAKVRDFGVMDDGTPYMVMEYLDGTDLRQTLKQFGKLPVEMAADYVIQACQGIAEAHSYGIVHRDLKPSNLYLLKHLDGSDLVKILDFGVSKMLIEEAEAQQLTAAGSFLGSPRYMSPEQLQSSGEVDGRSDVWSVGAIIYELITGRPPFVAPSTAALCVQIMTASERPPPLSDFLPDAPPQLEAVISRCLERDLDKRTPDAATLAVELAEAIGTPHLIAAAMKVVAVRDARAREMALSGSFSGHTTGSSKSSPSKPKSATGPSGFTPVNLAHTQSDAISKKRAPLIGLGVFAFVVVVGLLGYQLGKAPVVAPVSAVASAPRPEPAESATAVVTASAAPSPTQSGEAVAPGFGVADPTVAKKPNAAIAPKTRPGPAAKGTAATVATTPPVTPPAANCAQPFFVDESGIKRIKPECR